jgi:hypothetical protein
MLNTLNFHVRRNVIAYVALFVALGGTSYAATGGNFILGKSNGAGTPTQLTSATTNAAGTLKVANTASSGGRAIQGTSNTGQGVYGYSSQNAGLVGESLNFDGVYGVSNSATHAAVSAHNEVWGGYGLWAAGGDAANNTAAVHGQSTAGNAVEGISGKNTASGVYGQNTSSGYGVAGRANSGTAVLGDSSGGWAFNASGNATQSRTGGGFVKAMAFVSTGATDQIKQCFNSQLPAGQATSGDCGIAYSSRGTGIYDVDFGFKVSDRIVSVTPANACCNVARELDAFPFGGQPNKLEVTSHNANGNLDNSSFYILVY